MAIKIGGITVIYDDKIFQVGSGTTAQRPASPATGMIRYNTDLGTFEGYSGGTWSSIPIGSIPKLNGIQIGQSSTATQNFVIAVPATPDGTIKLARGNQGATTQDVLAVDASGGITIPNTATFSSTVTFNSNATFSDQQVSRAMLKDSGTVFVDKGTVSTGTVTLDYAGGSHQRLQVGGALTLAFSNFAPAGNLSSILVELVNAGSFAVTFPSINWVKADGTFTTNISSYISSIGRTSLQVSGTDFAVIWTRDSGTTLYGKLL